jgi:hypothetical protein
LRTAATVTALVVVYYRAPLDRPLDARAGVLFASALLLLGVLLVLQVRAIVDSQRPRLRAIRTLTLGLPLLLVIFAATYCTVEGQQPDAFTEPLNRTDGLYFTMTVFATVGFGDIAPQTQLARVLVTVQMILGLLAVGLIAKVVLGAVRVAEERRAQVPLGAGAPEAGDR